MESFENQDSNNSQSRQFSHSQSHTVPEEAQSPTFNKNIQSLQSLRNSGRSSYKIYDILNRIAAENDFHAMNFAVQEKFYDISFSYGETILEHSIRERNFQLTHLILEFGAKSNRIYAFHNNCSILRFILKRQYFDFDEALMKASYYGHHEVVKLLLTVPGIDVNAKSNSNNTALIWASIRRHQEIVKLLLAVPGIDVNAKNNKNETALISASNWGFHEVVKLLLTVPEIDVNAKDSDNNTALICASREGYSEVVKLLLTVPGIDVNAKGLKNRTALNWASEGGHHEVVKLIHDALK